jgi:hypothetical protein
MSDESRSVVATIGRLHAVIDDLTAALVAGDEPALLALEGRLVAALGDTMRIHAVDAADRDLVRAELQHTRAALLRCRGLGEALRQVAFQSMRALGVAADYDRDGSMKTGGHSARDFYARV